MIIVIAEYRTKPFEINADMPEEQQYVVSHKAFICFNWKQVEDLSRELRKKCCLITSTKIESLEGYMK